MLEQMILKHDAHGKVTSLIQTSEGLDFHFGQRSHAQRFADFVANCVPITTKNSKQLVSHDMNSNVYGYKYTIFCEICPVCTDDLVYIPKGHSQVLNGAPPLVLAAKVSNSLRFVDPLTLRSWNLSSEAYFKRPMPIVCSRANLTEYVVLDVELIRDTSKASQQKHHVVGRGKFQVGDVEIARLCDLGVNDDRITVRSHLAGVLHIGHHVMGYDLRAVNTSGIDAHVMEDFPADVILVKRWYKGMKKVRKWELKRMERHEAPGANPAVDVQQEEEDMENVMRDLEEDQDLRKNVNMYKHTAVEALPQQSDDDVDEDAPEVPLAELLEGLTLADDGFNEGPELPEKAQ